MISKPSTGLSATALPRSLDWPKERCGHAATCVSGPLLVIMGGLDSQIRTISDCWIYDLTAMLWQKVHVLTKLMILILIWVLNSSATPP